MKCGILKWNILKWNGMEEKPKQSKMYQSNRKFMNFNVLIKCWSSDKHGGRYGSIPCFKDFQYSGISRLVHLLEPPNIARYMLHHMPDTNINEFWLSDKHGGRYGAFHVLKIFEIRLYLDSCIS